MNTGLTAFWVSFPRDPDFPRGLGVTARSQQDALQLLESAGYDFHRRAREVEVRSRVTLADLDARHVVPNMGPIVVRGVWYPCHNVGFGAP